MFLILVTAAFMDWAPQISSFRPMQQINGGGSFLNSLVGAHSRVLDISCQFFFCNDLLHNINSILVSVDLSYLEQLFFNCLLD